MRIDTSTRKERFNFETPQQRSVFGDEGSSPLQLRKEGKYIVVEYLISFVYNMTS
jgi:hypothetical protein